jgi:hypothetical protein
MTTLAHLSAYAGELLDDTAVDRITTTLTPYCGRLLDNREAAKLVGELLFDISFRTIESWSDLRAKSIVVNRRRLQRAEDVVEAALHRVAVGQRKRLEFNAAA